MDETACSIMLKNVQSCSVLFKPCFLKTTVLRAVSRLLVEGMLGQATTGQFFTKAKA
jgi:hypothetical protein